jgi:hypothetical protein
MALTALVIGTAAAVLGTGRVTVPLLLSTTVVWAWVPVVQLFTGLLLVRGAGGRRAEALAAYFATGVYWSVWILAFSAVMVLAPRPFSIFYMAVATVVAPIALTAQALARLRRERFGDTRAAAWRRVLAHQALTHAVLVLYIGWAIALWPRIAGVVRG